MKPSSSSPLPVFLRAFFALFGVIGFTILGFIWLGLNDGFGEPPLFFKVFVSLIATGFIIMGFGAAIIGGKAPTPHGSGRPMNAAPSHNADKPRTYDCPNCGAGLGDADVSPSGDVKCGYCSRWFNIHGRA